MLAKNEVLLVLFPAEGEACRLSDVDLPRPDMKDKVDASGAHFVKPNAKLTGGASAPSSDRRERG